MTAHVYLGLAANVVVVLAVGYALLYGLGFARRLGSALELVALAYLVGWGALGTVLSFVLMWGLNFDLRTVLITVAVLVLLGLGAARLAPSVPSVSAAPSGSSLARGVVVVGAAVIVLAAVSAVILAVQSTWTPDSDTIALWVPHAQVIYYEHGLSLGAGGWPGVYHPEYPPLVSTMYALSFRFVGGFHPSLLPFNQVLLGLSFIGAVLGLLGRCVSRWIAFPTVALLMVAPEFFRRLDSLLPDQTLAYFVASAALACVLWLRERRTAWLVLAVILSAAGTLTKLEGESYAFLLAVIVVAGAVMCGNRQVAAAGLALFLGVAAIEPWRLWLGQHGLPTSAHDYHLSTLLHPIYMARRAGRVPYSVHEILSVMFSPYRWLVILPLALFAIVAALPRAPLLAAASGTWLLLAFAGLIVVYWAGTFEPFSLRDELQTSAHRVASTIVVVAGVIVPLVVGSTLEPEGARGENNPPERLASRPVGPAKL